MHKSIATINSPEFINLAPLDINPLMSSCEIKVLYIGENRNHTYISKEVATDMAKTLRGAPIVGYYKEEKEDFRDHGNQVILDDEGIKFNCLTKPYGFVSPDAKVWFQEFEDTDDFGNVLTREYLMTTGYLWTGQYEECKLAVEGEGKPHSMELDGDSMDGHWETNTKTGMDFFIINDATFSKLCILGDDVEPCFEGSKISAPEISTSFSKVDDNFKKTLFTMMQDLQFALKGGQNMDEQNTPVAQPAEEAAVAAEPVAESVPSVEPVAEEPVVTATLAEEPAPAAENGSEGVKDEPNNEGVTDFTNNESVDDASAETAPVAEEPAIDATLVDEEAPAADDGSEGVNDEPNNEGNTDFTNNEPVVDTQANEDPVVDENAEKYALLESENAELKNKLTELETKFSNLNTEYEKLVAFKAGIEDAEKDAMIDKFAMLSEEEKADVVANKSKYSLEEIESKLSVICVRKKVNFDSLDSSKINNNMSGKTFTYSLDGTSEGNAPAWVQAVKNNKR